MEPITHLAAGLLTAQALEPDPTKRRGLSVLCAVAATMPDFDIATSLIGLEPYLRHHRGLTHSVLALPWIALLLAWAARKLGAGLPLGRAWLAASLALATHIFLDVVTAFGTQILAPFSDYRLSFEGVFVVDPAFTMALFACILLGRQTPSFLGAGRRTFALAGLALLVCYPLLGNALRLNVQHRYEALLQARGQAYEKISVTPDALAPWYWKVLVASGPELTITTANPWDVARPYPATTLRRVPREELARLGREASIFGTFAWFAGHPASYPEAPPPPDQTGGQAEGQPRNQEGWRSVRYVDALFLNTGPVLSALFGHKPVFAELTAIHDTTGRLLAWLDEKGTRHPVPAPRNP